MKKILCTMLVIVMMLSVFAACGATTVDPTTGTTGTSGNSGTTGTVMTKPTDAPYTGPVVTFPLENPITFQMMIPKDPEDGQQEALDAHPLYKKLVEMTNVKIELMPMGSNLNEQLALAIQSGNYGDFYCGGSGNVIPTNVAVEYFDSGKMQPITDYINSTIMPNFWADLMELPEMFGMITAPDGEIYTLPKITSWGPQCHETAMWINKTWLDNLGLAVPTSIDDLETVLKAFAAQDANKNGDAADEIAWLVGSGHNNSHLEALYGHWGYGVKQGTNDMYLQVIDGEVIMSVVQPEWQEYLTWVKGLYDAGAINQDAFSIDNATLGGILNGTDSKVGFLTGTYHPANTTDEWISLPTLTNGDYEARWFYNCAVWGSKGQFYVMDKCENVEVLCAWMDLFFDLDIAYMTEVHPDNIAETTDGVLRKKTDAEGYDNELKTFPALVGGNWPRSFMASDYDRMPSTTEQQLKREEAYEKMKDAINTEIWPRPYWNVDVAGDIGTLATDINKVVVEWRTDFILGNADIQADWEDFIDEMNQAGLAEYMEHAQDAYTVVYNNIQSLKGNK